MATVYLNMERIAEQIEEWRKDEPQDDWWHWQRDFAEMFDIITEYQDAIEAEFARRCVGSDG